MTVQASECRPPQHVHWSAVPTLLSAPSCLCNTARLLPACAALGVPPALPLTRFAGNINASALCTVSATREQRTLPAMPHSPPAARRSSRRCAASASRGCRLSWACTSSSCGLTMKRRPKSCGEWRKGRRPAASGRGWAARGLPFAGRQAGRRAARVQPAAPHLGALQALNHGCSLPRRGQEHKGGVASVAVAAPQAKVLICQTGGAGAVSCCTWACMQAVLDPKAMCGCSSTPRSPTQQRLLTAANPPPPPMPDHPPVKGAPANSMSCCTCCLPAQ